MKVTLEQIDELRNRVNVSYEEAKQTLEKNDGDLIKSIIELEKKKGRKNEHRGSFTSFTNRLLSLKMSVTNKDGNILFDLPLVFVLFISIFAFWLVVFALVIAVIASCKIKVYRDKNSVNVDSLKRNMKETVDKIKVKSEEIIKVDDDDIDDDDIGESDSDENEIIIE